MDRMTASAAIPRSVRSLMLGIIDYAGLFPPARLTLEGSIRKYAAYRKGPDKWMLANFVIPAEQLSELDAFQSAFESASLMGFSVLGSSSGPATRALKADMDAVSDFEARYEGRVRVNCMEIKEAGLGGDAGLATTLRDCVTILRRSGREAIRLYVETGWSQESDSRLEAVAQAVAQVRRSSKMQLGLKIRSGGIEAHMFPPSERVARFITVCLNEGIPFKATAGLHHPIRRYHDSVRARMHGFINVFGGAALLYHHKISESELMEVLNEEDPGSFHFDESGFSWRDTRLDISEIETGRQFAHSFGSCSFDEPRDDLRTLHLL